MAGVRAPSLIRIGGPRSARLGGAARLRARAAKPGPTGRGQHGRHNLRASCSPTSSAIWISRVSPVPPLLRSCCDSVHLVQATPAQGSGPRYRGGSLPGVRDAAGSGVVVWRLPQIARLPIFTCSWDTLDAEAAAGNASAFCMGGPPRMGASHQWPGHSRTVSGADGHE